MESMADRIKAIRMRSGQSQQQIADILGMTRAGYSSIETGRNGKKYETLPRLAKALGCRIDDFFPEMDDQRGAPGLILDEDEDWWAGEDEDAPRPMIEESGAKGAPADDDWPENFMW